MTEAVCHTTISSTGTFANWQPAYATHQIATFPVTADKVPAVRGYGRVGLRGSHQVGCQVL
jgi:hypothetical protein